MSLSARGPSRRQLIGAAAAIASSPSLSFANDAYPTKPVRLVHGFAPGAAIDIVARPIAQALTASMRQTFLVDSRPGATGTIANEFVVRSAPDGYTLLIAPLAAVITASHLFPVRYDPLKDLQPIIRVAQFDTALVVPAASPASSLKELIALSKSRSDGLAYGSPGIGTGFHLAGELLAQVTGAKLLHVPYSGGGKAIYTDLLGGRLDFVFDSLGAVQPFVAQQQLRALAVTGASRSPSMPQVPTVAESGAAGYELTGWHGVFAPAGTPPAIAQALNEAISRALGQPELLAQWKQTDLQFVPNTPAQFGERIRSDHQRYGKLIVTAGIKASAPK